MRVIKNMMRGVIISLSFLALSALAGNADSINQSTDENAQDFDAFVLSVSVNTINDNLTRTNIKDWNYGGSFGLQYSFNPYVFVGGYIDLFRKNTFGYHLEAGTELPTENFTPYAKLIYNHAQYVDGAYTSGDKIQYAIGTTFTAPALHGISFMVELKDPIFKDETAKVGIGYNFTDDLSVGVSYWMALNNKYNGADIELGYGF